MADDLWFARNSPTGKFSLDANDAIRQRIEGAKQKYFHTCEVCGQPGETREGGWIKTLCDEHSRNTEKGRPKNEGSSFRGVALVAKEKGGVNYAERADK
jgi:hypothetical protein